MKTIILILSLFIVGLSSCVPTCGTKIIKHEITQPNCDDVSVVFGLKFHSTSDVVVVNELKIDTINIAIKKANLSFKPISIVPNFIDSNIKLNQSRLNDKLEKQLTQYSDSTVLNVFMLESLDNLKGYVPVPKDLKYIFVGYNNLFVTYDFLANDLAHEIGHWFFLNHNFKHCKYIMGNSACATVFTNEEIEAIKRAKVYREKYQTQ